MEGGEINIKRKKTDFLILHRWLDIPVQIKDFFISSYFLHNSGLSLGEGGVSPQFVVDVFHLDLHPSTSLLVGRRFRTKFVPLQL